MTATASDCPRYAGLTMTVPAPSRAWPAQGGGVDWALRDKAFDAARALGFAVRELPGTCLECARFAGDDSQRAADLTAAACDIDADLLMAMRGGYGAARLLPLLDWDRLGASAVPMVGYSDFTAVHLALLAKTGRVSWQGPTLRDLIDPAPLTLEGLDQVLGRKPFDLTWTGTLNAPQPGEALKTLTGPLWGGNLSVLVSLVGTPYFPALEGGLLFVEDVGEAAYRIERMFVTLELAGVLAKQQAILLGDCQGADRACGWEGDFCLQTAVDWLTARTGLPVITGLPFGHLHAKASLPVGMPVTLTTAASDAGHVFRLQAA